MFDSVHALTCNHMHSAPLQYYYDDDWGVKGSKVWFTAEEKYHTGELHVCLDCGAVFVKLLNTIE